MTITKITEITEIYDLLRGFGVKTNRTGFYFTSYAIYRTIQQPERLSFIRKNLYSDVAEHYGTSPEAVKQEIERVVRYIWKNSASKLAKMSRKPLNHHPCAVQFFYIVTDFRW